MVHYRVQCLYYPFDLDPHSPGFVDSLHMASVVSTKINQCYTEICGFILDRDQFSMRFVLVGSCRPHDLVIFYNI